MVIPGRYEIKTLQKLGLVLPDEPAILQDEAFLNLFRMSHIILTLLGQLLEHCKSEINEQDDWTQFCDVVIG